MENKTCGECKNRYSDEGTCPVRFGVADTDDASKCDTFEPTPKPLPITHYGLKRPPQSFCYLKEENEK